MATYYIGLWENVFYFILANRFFKLCSEIPIAKAPRYKMWFIINLSAIENTTDSAMCRKLRPFIKVSCLDHQPAWLTGVKALCINCTALWQAGSIAPGGLIRFKCEQRFRKLTMTLVMPGTERNTLLAFRESASWWNKLFSCFVWCFQMQGEFPIHGEHRLWFKTLELLFDCKLAGADIFELAPTGSRREQPKAK